MKKYLKVVALLSLILIPSLSFAAIDSNQKFGNKNDQVLEMQDYLFERGILKVSPTGFFGPSTLKAVKEYQTEKGLPSTGYVGVLTRKAINGDLEIDIGAALDAELQETGSTSTPAIFTDAFKQAQETNRLLGLQIQAQLDAQAKLDSINQNINSLNTVVTNLQPNLNPTPTSLAMTVTVSQPVCISTSTSEWTINTDWTKVKYSLLHFLGGSIETDGQTIAYQANSNSGIGIGYPATHYGSTWVNTIGNIHYSVTAYSQYDPSQTNQLAYSEGTMVIPDCRGFVQ